MSIKKYSLNQIISFQGFIFFLLFSFSLYQVLYWNLFPWLNLSILFSVSTLFVLLAKIVKIKSRRIKIIILTIASSQILASLFLLSNHELLINHWQWLFFSIPLLFCFIFWELFSRRRSRIRSIGYFTCSFLFILTFLKFMNQSSWIDYALIGLLTFCIVTLIFSENNQSVID